jgi:hypothetical protein
MGVIHEEQPVRPDAEVDRGEHDGFRRGAHLSLCGEMLNIAAARTWLIPRAWRAGNKPPTDVDVRPPSRDVRLRGSWLPRHGRHSWRALLKQEFLQMVGDPVPVL